MGNIMNGSEACAFKITFVTKVGTEEDYCYWEKKAIFHFELK